MKTIFENASEVLLKPYGLDEQSLEQVLTKAMAKGIDLAEIYLQYGESELWRLEEGIIKKGIFNVDNGFGVRAISGEKTGFSHSGNLIISDMEEAAIYARNIAKSGSVGEVVKLQKIHQQKSLYPVINPLITFSEEEKISLLKSVDSIARKLDPRVIQVDASLMASYKVVLVANTDGVLGSDIRPMVHLNVSVLVEENGRKERGSAGGGRRSEYGIFIAEKLFAKYAEEAVRIALVNLQAIHAPAGIMPVVLGNGWPAVMLHEAVGHGLEADFNRKSQSVYSGRIGEQVAAKGVSIVDQGDFPGNRRGSLNIDDEGTPTQRTVLIEDGILKGYMYDKLNARLMNTKSTGNGRRASYVDLPIPRMTNTFMLEGQHQPEEIIASVDKGIYAVNFSGGQVDITSGEFVFSTSEAYLIENGKITTPIKGATLVGNGPAVLHKITMVGNDLQLDSGVGTCGKSGQSVPVGIGQPTLKISELTIGGTNF